MKSAAKGRIDLDGAIGRAMDQLAKGDLGIREGNGLSAEGDMVSASKKIMLLACGAALGRYSKGLGQEQEVVALLADMVIQIYAMESCLLRALKNLAKSGETKARLHGVVAKAFVGDAFPKVISMVKQVLLACCEDGELEKNLSLLRQFDLAPGSNIIALRRETAEAAKSGSRYPFTQI
jgi:alkylation response protein AidB-like acyl-CoA dehydrogenase